MGLENEGMPQDWAWQMSQWKPAQALLIKHNEAWDHKIFHLIPGSHEVGADQLSWQRRRVCRGALQLIWDWDRHKVGDSSP